MSVLVSTLTLHAGLESYQSQTHLPSQRAQHTCDICLALQAGGRGRCGGRQGDTSNIEVGVRSSKMEL